MPDTCDAINTLWFETGMYLYCTDVQNTMYEYAMNKTPFGQCHAKRDLRTLQIVKTKTSPYMLLNSPIRDHNVHKARQICAIDVTSVKKCRP